MRLPILTETHFTDPANDAATYSFGDNPSFYSGYRMGRFLNFLGTIQVNGQSSAQGLAVDPATVLCVTDGGIATVYGSGDVYFAVSSTPPQLTNNSTLGGGNQVLQVSNVGVNWFKDDGQSFNFSTGFTTAVPGQTAIVSIMNGNVVLNNGTLPPQFVGIPNAS